MSNISPRLSIICKNIIPQKDMIAHIDDPAENYQIIRCLDRQILNCHDSLRSLCEISYSCGSRERPVICTCVQDYGYPEPTPKNGTTRTFAEACGIQK
jgi:lipase ATG15